MLLTSCCGPERERESREPATNSSTAQGKGPRYILAVSQSRRDAGGVLRMPGSCESQEGGDPQKTRRGE